MYNLTPKSDGSYLAECWDASGDYHSIACASEDEARAWVRDTYHAADAEETLGGMRVVAEAVLAAATVACGFAVGVVVAWWWF